MQRHRKATERLGRNHVGQIETYGQHAAQAPHRRHTLPSLGTTSHNPCTHGSGTEGGAGARSQGQIPAHRRVGVVGASEHCPRIKAPAKALARKPCLHQGSVVLRTRHGRVDDR